MKYGIVLLGYVFICCVYVVMAIKARKIFSINIRTADKKISENRNFVYFFMAIYIFSILTFVSSIYFLFYERFELKAPAVLAMMACIFVIPVYKISILPKKTTLDEEKENVNS